MRACGGPMKGLHWSAKYCSPECKTPRKLQPTHAERNARTAALNGLRAEPLPARTARTRSPRSASRPYTAATTVTARHTRSATRSAWKRSASPGGRRGPPPVTSRWNAISVASNSSGAHGTSGIARSSAHNADGEGATPTGTTKSPPTARLADMRNGSRAVTYVRLALCAASRSPPFSALRPSIAPAPARTRRTAGGTPRPSRSETAPDGRETKSIGSRLCGLTWRLESRTSQDSGRRRSTSPCSTIGATARQS